MNPAELQALLLRVVRQTAGPEAEVADGAVTLERPRDPSHGDWASSFALKLAKGLGRVPRELATEVAELLVQEEGIAAAEVAGPGFVNIRLDAAAAGELARRIVDEGEGYGRGDLYAGVTMNLEFVSANPTGPIHLGGTRWAAVGDSLARVFQAQGGIVTREYYFNDHGSQIDRFARSLLAAPLG